MRTPTIPMRLRGAPHHTKAVDVPAGDAAGAAEQMHAELRAKEEQQSVVEMDGVDTDASASVSDMDITEGSASGPAPSLNDVVVVLETITIDNDVQDVGHDNRERDASVDVGTVDTALVAQTNEVGAGADDGMQCIVCTATASDGPLWQCPVREHHVCCHECIAQFTHARVSDGMSTVPCPAGFADCAHEITENELRGILHGEVAEEYAALAAAHRVPNGVECPACGKICRGDPKRPDMVCDREGCGLKFCFHHGLEHPERNCKIKAQGPLERLHNWRWRKLHTRKCNRCNFRIQKNGGCNHMTCRCGHEICWRCGGDYNRNGQRGHSNELFPSPSQYKYCCNDAKMQAKRVAATTGILTVGVAAASIAAAGLLVYFIGKVTLSVVAAPPRAIMKARKRRRLQRELRRRQQDLRRDGCACYFPLDGGGCMFCGRINPYRCAHYFPLATVGEGLTACMFCNERATVDQYLTQHPGAPIPTNNNVDAELSRYWGLDRLIDLHPAAGAEPRDHLQLLQNGLRELEVVLRELELDQPNHGRANRDQNQDQSRRSASVSGARSAVLAAALARRADGLAMRVQRSVSSSDSDSLQDDESGWSTSASSASSSLVSSRRRPPSLRHPSPQPLSPRGLQLPTESEITTASLEVSSSHPEAAASRSTRTRSVYSSNGSDSDLLTEIHRGVQLKPVASTATPDAGAGRWPANGTHGVRHARSTPDLSSAGMNVHTHRKLSFAC